MQNVYLNIGSNINRNQNIKSGLESLTRQFGTVHISSVYESKAIGGAGDNFYNLAALIQTDLPLKELSSQLKRIEDDHGRNRHDKSFKGRTLDIDIVLYGAQMGVIDGIELPRPELYYNSFVLKPMAELAGNMTDPKTGVTYETLWLRSEKSINHRLEAVSL